MVQARRQCASCDTSMRNRKAAAAVKLPGQREQVLCPNCAQHGMYFDRQGQVQQGRY